MSSPAIEATSPTVVPASDAATYDKWWFSPLTVNGDTPNTHPVTVNVRLRKYRTLTDGTIEFSPVDQPVNIVVADVFAEASNDPDLYNAFQAITAAIVARGKKLGIL